MNAHNEHEHQTDPDDQAMAVCHADAGSQAWRSVVHAQGAARPDHADFYALAGELVDTLRSLDSLIGLLAAQAMDYPATVTAAGGRLYDDENAVPAHRIRTAVLALAETRQALSTAERAANRHWSAISHIGVDHHPDTHPSSGGEPR